MKKMLIEVSTEKELLIAILEEKEVFLDEEIKPKVIYLTGCADAYLVFGNLKKVFIKEKDFMSAVVKEIENESVD